MYVSRCMLAMLSFSVTICYYAIEMGLYLDRKKLIGPGIRFSEKKKPIICLSQAKPFRKIHHFVVYMHGLASAC